MLCLWATMLLVVGCDFEDTDLFRVFGKASLAMEPNIVVSEGASVVEIRYQIKGNVRKSGDDSEKDQMSFAWFTEDVTAHRGVDYRATPLRVLGLSGSQAGRNVEGSKKENIPVLVEFSGADYLKIIRDESF